MWPRGRGVREARRPSVTSVGETRSKTNVTLLENANHNQKS
jgi:hypothetical protein